MTLLLDAVLAVALIGCAAGSLLRAPDRAAVGWYVAFALVLAATSLRLGVVEVAVAEALVGAGATGWLLWRTVRVTPRRAPG